MAEMTHRERVQTALNHQEPDRVPLDIGGGASTSIVIEGYEKLKKHLGISRETRVMNRVFRVAELDPAVLDALGSDCHPLPPGRPENWIPSPSPPGTFKDIWGVTWRRIQYGDGCFYNEAVEHPLGKAVLADLDHYSWPDPCDPGYTRGLRDRAREMYENTDFALIGDGGFKSFWELAYTLRGFDRLLMDLVDDPAFVSALLERLLQINLEATGRYLDAVGDCIQVFRTADDVATQMGLLMSPAFYRKYLKPLYKIFYSFIHSKTDAKIFYHSCGNVAGLLDDLIEIGLDIINPVQVSALGDTAPLKSRFGGDLVFWGAIDTQQVLPRGTPEEVGEEVRRRIGDLAPGGGFVAASVHNIQPDVPPQNILAMAEAVRAHGVYPIRTQ